MLEDEKRGSVDAACARHQCGKMEDDACAIKCKSHILTLHGRKTVHPDSFCAKFEKYDLVSFCPSVRCEMGSLERKRTLTSMSASECGESGNVGNVPGIFKMYENKGSHFCLLSRDSKTRSQMAAATSDGLSTNSTPFLQFI